MRLRSRFCFVKRIGPPPDQRAIALAFLGALRVLARARPVAVAVDDIQWLDRSSAFVLEFALRRLGGDALAFLLALRDEEATPPRSTSSVRCPGSGYGASESGRSAWAPCTGS